MTMETKKCGKCGQVLPTSEFYKKSNSKDGYQYVCKHCQKMYSKNSHPKASVKVSVDGIYKRNPKLAEFHPRELIDELRARGYKGKLEITREIVL